MLSRTEKIIYSVLGALGLGGVGYAGYTLTRKPKAPAQDKRVLSEPVRTTLQMTTPPAPPADTPQEAVENAGDDIQKAILDLKRAEPNLSDVVAQAVAVSLLREKDPARVLEFGQSLMPDFPISASLLVKKSTAMKAEQGQESTARVSGAVVGKFEISDVGDAISDATKALGNAVGTLKKIPGIEQIADKVNDFANTGVGKAFLTVVSPLSLSALFTNLPGVGMWISQALAAAGPIAQNALPGLVRGERVDIAFIDSAKDLAQRLGPAAAGQLSGPALDLATNAMKNMGMDPNTLAGKIDELRRQAGLRLATDQLPESLQRQADAITKPYVDKLNASLPELAKLAGVPEEVMQVAIDGVTRSAVYPKKTWTVDGRERTAEVIAQEKVQADLQRAQDDVDRQNRQAAINDANVTNAIDSMLLETPPTTAMGVFGRTRGPGMVGSFDGKLGRVPFSYVQQRLAYWAQQGRRSADAGPEILPLLEPAPATADFPQAGSHALVDTIYAPPVQMTAMTATTPDGKAIQVLIPKTNLPEDHPTNVAIQQATAEAISTPGLSDSERMKMVVQAAQSSGYGIAIKPTAIRRYSNTDNRANPPLVSLPTGTKFVITGPATFNGWYPATYQGKRGVVPRSDVMPVPTPGAPSSFAKPQPPVVRSARHAAAAFFQGEEPVHVGADNPTPWNSPNWTGDPLVLYSAPAASKPVALVPNGAIVTLSGDQKNGYFSVYYGADERAAGWAKAIYLKPEPQRKLGMTGTWQEVPPPKPLSADLLLVRARYVKEYTGYDASAPSA